MKKYSLLVLALLAAGCAVPPATVHLPPPGPPPATLRAVGLIVRDQAGQPLAGASCSLQDVPGWTPTVTTNAAGYLAWLEVTTGLSTTAVRCHADGYLAYERSAILSTVTNEDLEPIVLLSEAPALDKRDFIEHYQGNFGSIAADPCYTVSRTLFDPVALLVTWANDKPCFERLMQQHADRGDNRVVIDPRASYHESVAPIDLWHDPATFRRFIDDIRRHVNNRGEHFKVLTFFAADGHIDTFLRNGEGDPDRNTEAHFARDVSVLAGATRDVVDGTATCWECRHQRDYITPGGYERIGRIVAAAFPNAWHGQHLISGSSSWSSWNCDPDAPDAAAQTPPCTVENAHMEGDDPYRGNELAPWVKCSSEGWCDGILYQFHVGDDYLNPDNHPNYTPAPGALGRFFEIAVRMGRDPWSKAAQRRSDPRWPLNGGVDVLAFEFIYDAYNGRSSEAYGIEFCERALAFGGWGCGSASWRR